MRLMHVPCHTRTLEVNLSHYCVFRLLILLLLTSVNVISVDFHLCFVQTPAARLPTLNLEFLTYFAYFFHHTIKMENAFSVFRHTYRYPLHRSTYPSHGSLVCFLWRDPESEIYSHLTAPPPLSPRCLHIRLHCSESPVPSEWWNQQFEGLSLLQRLKSPEIHCEWLLRDCGSSLTRGHWAAGAAVNDCRGADDDYGSLWDAVWRRSAWSRTGTTPGH